MVRIRLVGSIVQHFMLRAYPITDVDCKNKGRGKKKTLQKKKSGVKKNSRKGRYERVAMYSHVVIITIQFTKRIIAQLSKSQATTERANQGGVGRKRLAQTSRNKTRVAKEFVLFLF